MSDFSEHGDIERGMEYMRELQERMRPEQPFDEEKWSTLIPSGEQIRTDAQFYKMELEQGKLDAVEEAEKITKQASEEE